MKHVFDGLAVLVLACVAANAQANPGDCVALPSGLIDFGVEINPDGTSAVSSIPVPTGLLDFGAEINPDGTSAVSSIPVPIGLLDFGVEIAPDGAFLGDLGSCPISVPAIGPYGLVVLVMLIGCSARFLSAGLRNQVPPAERAA